MIEDAVVVIIGGGFSGAMTALHLSRQAPASRIIVIDAREHLGLGLAYSTGTQRHLLNVPAGKISAFPDDPGHFLRWLQTNGFAEATPRDFIPRAVFGRYVRSLLEQAQHVEHRRDTVASCGLSPDGKQAELTLASGRALTADAVVLALGNFDPPPLPDVEPEVEQRGLYCRSAWSDATFADLDPAAPVALVGSGLTAIDVLLRLRDQGHHGPVTAVSRHAALPMAHVTPVPCVEPVIAGPAPRTARQLLHQFHQALRNGIPWRAAVDSLRSRTNELWQALPPQEQRRFRRHLQRRWEITRHRMAPEIARFVEHERATGGFRIVRGSVVGIRAAGDSVIVDIAAPRGGAASVTAARAINCTGPDLNYRRVDSPLLRQMFCDGLIEPGPGQQGLAHHPTGALVSAQGQASEVLYCIGPARQGQLFESIAVPELRAQAAGLAVHLSTYLKRKERCTAVSAEA